MLFGLNKRVVVAFASILTAVLPYPASAQEVKEVKLHTVVIDAGHGGHDAGAMSPDKRIRECDINLEIALALGQMIKDEFSDVKVIYTRDNDTFVPLAERANIANRNHADLFISIHVNSARRGSSASGTETFVMGTDKSESNMEVCRQENNVILLEDDYNATYQGFDPDNVESYIFFNLMQNAYFEQSIAIASMIQQNLKQGPITRSRGVKQAPFLVLWRTTMPSVLVEVGFLSNSADRAALTDRDRKKKMASAIFNAFRTFKEQYDSHTGFTYEDQAGEYDDIPSEAVPSGNVAVSSNVAAPLADTVVSSPEIAAPPAADNGRFYRIQIFATAKKFKEGDPQLKGVTDYECTLVKGLYKYTVGRYGTKDEAQRNLPKIRAKFKGAFVTCF